MVVNESQPARAATSAPRAAATLVVVRDAPAGLEVLLLRRAEKGDHNSGAWVFPGGLVDAGDRRAHAVCAGLDDTAASAALGVEAGGLDFHVAAIRECFEEAGILFAIDAAGAFPNLVGETGARLAALRAPLGRGECAIDDLCRELGLRLAVDRLHYIAHWLTPLGRAKRFDTRFFVAVLPPGQDSAHDAVETVEHVWLRPAVALAPENTRRLMTPTRATIAELGAFADSAALLAWAAAPRTVERVLPRLGVDAQGPRPVLPEEPAWAEIGRLDPDGRGEAWCALQADVAVRLSARLVRVSTSAGENSYVVLGAAGGTCAVVGPGSADPAHLDALVAAAPGPIGWIVVLDRLREAAARALLARTGAQVIGPVDVPDLGPDTTLRRIDAIGGAPAVLIAEERTAIAAADATSARAATTAGGSAIDPRCDWIAPADGFLVAVRPTMETP